MNLKKMIATLAVAACLCATACSQPQPSSFNATWRKIALDANETVEFSGAETAEYELSFEKGSNTYYSVNYTNGSYVTSLSSHEGKYLYETTLKADVQYDHKGEKTSVFHDEITSSVLFESTQKGLAPVRSEKRFAVHVPYQAAPASLGSCYSEYYYVVKTDYATNVCSTDYFTDATFATPHATFRSTQSTFKNDGKYSLVDNEELYVATRALKGSGTNTLYVYNTAATKLQKVQVTANSKKSTEFTFEIVGREATTHTISYIPYSIAIKEDNPGEPHELWIAETTETTNNEYRNVLLKIKTPLTYNLGSLIFNLKKVSFLDE